MPRPKPRKGSPDARNPHTATHGAGRAAGVAMPADVTELARLPTAVRAELLGELIGTEGIQPAPGPDSEAEVLADMLAPLGIELPDPEILPETLWSHYFKAPLALMQLLRLFQPHLMSAAPDPLRVLYLGADRAEVLDEGRWFTLAWQLLGFPRPLKITAVGPALAAADQWESSPWAYLVAQYPSITACLPGPLGTTLATAEGAVDWEDFFDVVVMHHPGFVGNMASWCGDLAFGDLAGFAAIPIVGTSFDATDFRFDRAGMAVCGRPIERVYSNPLAHLPPGAAVTHAHGTRLRWSPILWSANRDPQIRENYVAPSQQRALDWIHAYWEPTIMAQSPFQEYARWVWTCPMQFDDLYRWLYATDDVRLDARTGAALVYDISLAPSELTKRAVSTRELEGRLQLLPALLEEISQRAGPEALRAARRVGGMPSEDGPSAA